MEQSSEQPVHAEQSYAEQSYAATQQAGQEAVTAQPVNLFMQEGVATEAQQPEQSAAVETTPQPAAAGETATPDVPVQVQVDTEQQTPAPVELPAPQEETTAATEQTAAPEEPAKESEAVPATSLPQEAEQINEIGGFQVMSGVKRSRKCGDFSLGMI